MMILFILQFIALVIVVLVGTYTIHVCMTVVNDTPDGSVGSIKQFKRDRGV
jgi:hypothetical protein